jgi:hypothetical protein
VDPTLTTGLLAIAGTCGTGALSLAGFLVKSHVATLATMVANDTKNSDAIGKIANEMQRTREVQERQEARIASLEVTIEDKRNSELVSATNEANTLMKQAIGNITGKFAAVNVDRAAAGLPDLEVGPQGDRPPRGSAPR